MGITMPNSHTLTSFSGSSEWAEKKSLVHTVCVYSVLPRISGNFGNFRKICSVILTSARHANFSRIKDGCHWLQWTRERWRHSALQLQELSMHLSILVKCCSMWLTQFLLLKFTDCLERSNADCYRQSDTVLIGCIIIPEVRPFSR